MQTVRNNFWDAGKGNLTAQNTRKPFGGRGSALDPAEGAYSAPANPLVGGEGLAVPSPRTPSPALGPSGLASSTPTIKLVPTPLHTWTSSWSDNSLSAHLNFITKRTSCTSGTLWSWNTSETGLASTTDTTWTHNSVRWLTIRYLTSQTNPAFHFYWVGN